MSEHAKRRWEATPVEIRNERAQRGRDAYFTNHPERRVAFAWLKSQLEAGTLQKGTCEECQQPAYALFDWQSPCWTFIGWRCKSHREVTSMNEKPTWEMDGRGRWNHRCRVDGRGKRVMTEMQIAQLKGCPFCKGYPSRPAAFRPSDKPVYVKRATAYWKTVML